MFKTQHRLPPMSLGRELAGSSSNGDLQAGLSFVTCPVDTPSQQPEVNTVHGSGWHGCQGDAIPSQPSPCLNMFFLTPFLFPPEATHRSLPGGVAPLSPGPAPLRPSRRGRAAPAAACAAQTAAASGEERSQSRAVRAAGPRPPVLPRMMWAVRFSLRKEAPTSAKAR